jgi:hypothetical protein
VTVCGRDYEAAAAALYRSIRELARRVARRGRFLTVSGHRYPIGCHVHVGAPCGADLVQLVDNKVGDVVKLSGKARGEYARRAAWRQQPHGWEYRTPPSAILATEDLAVPTFAAIAETVAEPQQDHTPVVDRVGRESWQRAMRLLGEGVHFGFEFREVSPARFQMSEGDIFSPRFRLEAYAHLPLPVQDRIYFFGYRAARGNVTNLPEVAQLFEWGVVEGAPRWRDDGRLAVGLPLSYREHPYKVGALSDVLCNIVVREGSKEGDTCA